MPAEASWLWRFWREYRLMALWLVFLTTLKVALMLSYPIFFKWVVDEIKEGSGGNSISVYIIVFCMAGTASSVVYIVLQTGRVKMNLLFEKLMRNRVFSRVLEKDLQFFKRFGVGEMVTRLLDDISDEKLCWFACSGIFRCLEALLTFGFMMAIMFQISPFLTLVSVSPLILITMVFLFVRERLHAMYHLVQQSISKVNTFLEICLSGIRVVKAYCAEPFQGAIFQKAINERVQTEIRLAKLHSAVHQSYQGMNQAGILLILWVGGSMVIRGEITLGEFVAFSTYIGMVVDPMLSIGMFFTRGKQAFVSISRLKEIEETEVTINSPSGISENGVSEEFEGLRFEKVSFCYSPNAPPVLFDVDFQVRKGEMLAITGAVGAGKSTLSLLTLRFVDPCSGRILLNGRDIKEWPLNGIRRMIGWVPQEAMLFSDTVLENIRFMRGKLEDSEIRKSARLAQISREIEGFPDGYFQKVGERGITLSGGQKQRVALARALVGKPQLLILDDVTAALDASTEEALWADLDSLRGKASFLLMTHRLSTLKRADRVIVLEEGRVSETGTYEELVVQNGILSELVRRETLREKLSCF